MLIFGFRTYVATLGMLTLACRNGHTAAHRLVKISRKFTLFFIPVLPFSRKYRTICTHCGVQVAWSKEDAERAMGSATAAGAAPIDPVSPPLLTGGSPQPMAAPVAVPPGWYPDPAIPSTLRFWDGNGWTAAQHNPVEG